MPSRPSTRALGIELPAGYRPAGFYYPAGGGDHLNAGPNGSFFERHPELRAREEDDRPAPRLSYAFPETRADVISVMREIAAYPVDGGAILYNRRPPLSGNDQPMLDSFREQYGLDSRALERDDPRWLDPRATILTTFMRELRRAMDEESERPGRTKRLAITAVVANAVENRLHGMDVATWASEGLIDMLVTYSSAPALDGMAEAWADLSDLDPFVEATRGTACELAPNLMPRVVPPELYRRKVAAIYEKGIDRLFFWDAASGCGRANFSPSWDAARRLGHRDEIEAWRRVGEPAPGAPSLLLRRAGDWDMRYGDAG